MRVVLAVQHRDIQLALQLYLDDEPGLSIVGTAIEAASLRALIRTAHPDLVILDWDLPGYAPGHLLAEVKRSSLPPQVIVLGTDERLRRTALAAGADCFALSGDLPDDFSDAVRQIRSQWSESRDQLSRGTKGE